MYLPYHWDKGDKGESKPSLCSLIGWESSRHSLNQSNSKLKPVATSPPTFSRALSNFSCFCFEFWLVVIFSFALIGDLILLLHEVLEFAEMKNHTHTLAKFKLKFPSFSYVIPATKSSQFLYSPNGKIT